MNRDFPTTVVASFFIVGAALIWLGWMAMPVHLGVYFLPENFPAIMERFHLWIWMFRFHLFGDLITVMALVAFGSTIADQEDRVVIWPGIAVCVGGLFVTALGQAFYYHHGAWGALTTQGQPAEVLAAHVESLRIDTEYVTCLVRFGRVFFGLGQLVFGLGLLRGKLVPGAISLGAMLLGVAAMALTMALPDELVYYVPIFHLNCLWLLAFGVVVPRSALQPDRKLAPSGA
jgi:hypothetical protein